MRFEVLWRILCCFLTGFLFIFTGCAGIPTKKEKLAREEIKTVESVYRPTHEEEMDTSITSSVISKPVLPSLTNDSGLSELINYALLRNHRVESAFYEWKGAVEAITTARSRPDLMFSFGAEISLSMPALAGSLMFAPESSWPGPGKLPLRADAAYEESRKKRYDFESEMLAVALAVKRAYYQLWVLEEQIRWMRKALLVVDDMEKLARDRLAVGKVTQQDVLRAQMERDRLKTELANMEDSRTSVTIRLRSALGIGIQESMPVFVLQLVPTPTDFTEQSLMEVAFKQNPRLKEMRSEVSQAVSLYHLARKSSVPDYTFGLGGRGLPVALMPTVGITLPIWRDKITAEIAQGEAGIGAARAKLSAEELELAVRFAETAFAWREADRNARLYSDKLLPKANASLESARAGYIGGVSGFLDFQEAERTLLDYRINHAMATGQREIFLSEMSLVILGRWPEGVMNILPSDQTAENIPREK